jgi:glycerol-3-phosphate acyltransferase PlsY
VAAASGSVAPVTSGETSAAVGHPFPTFLDDGGGVLVAAARLVRTLAVPLALILLVIGFLFMQNRIDRKDPKLALAPVGSEHLTFS